MKAAVITRPGGPEVLAIEERPVPVPGPKEILVRVHASALNRADLIQRQGYYPAPPGAPPDIPGLEYAGEVVECGSDVGGWRTGDRVFGIVAGGANAEYLVTDEQTAVRIPPSLDWIEAGAIPEAFMTANDAMMTQAGLSANESVLIHAVGSGVGLAATQLARARKAIPYGTARQPEKIERARAMGLEDGIVVVDDYDAIARAAAAWTSGRGIDLTLDLVGGPYLGASITAAAPLGRIMLVGTVAGRTGTIPIGMILGKRLTLRGTVLRGRSIPEKRVVTEAFARDVVPLLESGALRANVDRVFELDAIREAHEALESNQTTGKVVLRIGA